VYYFFIGDSFGYGQCVQRKNNIPSIFEKLTKKKFINLSMPANGFLLHFAILSEFEKEIKKNNSKIIFFVNDSDFANTANELKNEILIRYLEEINYSQNVKSNIKKINLMHDDLFKKRFDKFFFQNFLKLSLLKKLISWKISTPFDEVSIDNENLKKIDKIFYLLRNKFLDNEIIIIRSPLKNQFANKKYNLQYKFLLENIVKKYEFEYMNIDELFLNENNPLDLFSKYHGHYNLKGYELVSNFIANKLN